MWITVLILEKFEFSYPSYLDRQAIPYHDGYFAEAEFIAQIANKLHLTMMQFHDLNERISAYHRIAIYLLLRPFFHKIQVGTLLRLLLST